MGLSDFGCILFGDCEQCLSSFDEPPKDITDDRITLFKEFREEILNQSEREVDDEYAQEILDQLMSYGQSIAYLEIFEFPPNLIVNRTNFQSLIKNKQYLSRRIKKFDYDWDDQDFDPPLNYGSLDKNYSIWQVPKFSDEGQPTNYTPLEVNSKNQIWIRNISGEAYEHYLSANRSVKRIDDPELIYLAVKHQIPWQNKTRSEIYASIVKYLAETFDLK